MREHFRTSPEIRFKKRIIKIGRQELGHRKSNLNIVTIGSLEVAPEENLTTLGEFLASNFADIITDANKNYRKVAFDMPTGASPKPFYEALKRIVDSKKVNLLNVIFFGHEAEWPPATGNPSLDYENQRRKILIDLGIEIKEITEPGMTGNYIPMYQAVESLLGSDDEIKQAALASAKKYDTILETLLERQDVVSIGYYGVGVDGHGFGELQNFHMFPDFWPQTEDTFITPIEDYSLDKELWFLTGVFDSSQSSANDLWNRREDYPNVRYLMGLGRRIMSRLDYSFHIFNSLSKYIALTHTLGSMRGEGQGEKMLDRFKSFVIELRESGIKIPDISEIKDCHQAVKLILSIIGPNSGEKIFSDFVRLIQTYFGLKTPVSMEILERAMKDKSSTLIMPANILKGKEYEFLAK